MMRQVFDKIFPWIWASVWFTLPLPVKFNSISLILFGAAAIWNSFLHRPVFERRQIALAGLFALLFAWQALSQVLIDGSLPEWKLIERKLSLLLIPLTLLLLPGGRQKLSVWAIRGLFAGLIITGIHLLMLASLKIITGEPSGSFTYHAFTGPYKLGAIYYSLFLSAALYYLAFRQTEPFLRKYRLALGIFFLVLLLFCASKLFIVLTLPAVILPFFQKMKMMTGIKKYLFPLIFIILLIIGSIPLLNRFSELKNTDLKVVTLEQYRYDTPLNGLTFRMILWRLAGEIMVDENAWLAGTGIDNRQETLDRYYTRYGIYTGNPDLGDTGYLGYNFHNQYLEIFVGAGIPGLVILLLIIPGMFFITKRSFLLPFSFNIVIFIFFLTESVLERQAGLVFFCLLWNYSEDFSLKSA